MNVLAIVTSHPQGSVAVFAGGDTVIARQFGGGSSHLTGIGRAVDAILEEAGLTVREIDRLALDRGPGSFTGLRIGMAFARGLCAGLDVDLAVLTSLELIALPLLGGGRPVCAMVDARKGEVYGAVYDGTGRDGTPAGLSQLLSPRARDARSMVEEARPFSPAYAGTGALHYRAEIEAGDPGGRIVERNRAIPSAEILAAVAADLVPLSPEELASLEPFYVRPSDAVFKPLKPIDPNG